MHIWVLLCYSRTEYSHWPLLSWLRLPRRYKRKCEIPTRGGQATSRTVLKNNTCKKMNTFSLQVLKVTNNKVLHAIRRFLATRPSLLILLFYR